MDRSAWWKQVCEGTRFRPTVYPEDGTEFNHGLGGPIRSQLLPGFWVGGNLGSPGSIVTCLGFGMLPPRGPRSRNSPGRWGDSPGF
jgi:hypothetical protein